MNRREFLTASAGSLANFGAMSHDGGQANRQWFMPDESARHRRTWMAFGPREEIWGDLLDGVRADLALLATTISTFEPVSMLVRPEDRTLAARLCRNRVELIEAPLDDLWIRDSGPTFVISRDGKLGAVALNFNGWSGKQTHQNDAKVARLVASTASAIYLKADLVGEGGGIEVDGHGTAIVTESCFLNGNRNPGLTKRDCERQFKDRLGVRKVIWLPGVRGKDITDGHTDFYARFSGLGLVIAGLEPDRRAFDHAVTREHLRILRSARDTDGRPLQVMTLEAPRQVRWKGNADDFAAGYVNYYLVNGGVIAPEFGDRRADARCKEMLTRLFPGRKVVQLHIDAIAAGGGGIHCATQQEPFLPAPDS